MIKSVTYDSSLFKNSDSVFEITSTTLLTLFIGNNTSEMKLGGVNLTDLTPSTFIDFVQDSPQLTIQKASSTVSINSSNDCLTIVTLSKESTQYTNPLSNQYTVDVECLGPETVDDYKWIIVISIGIFCLLFISICIYCICKWKI